MNLLPPSAFESKTRQVDAWSEVAKVREEVAKLKQENIQLREAQRTTPEPAPVLPPKQEAKQRGPAEICKYNSKKEDFKYIDELINKQACEITELKNEIRNLKCQHREEMTEMERQLTLKERENTHQVASLEVELKAAEDRYENQVDRLSREHQRETDMLTATVDKLQDELESTRSRSSARISDLETLYENFKKNSEEQVEKMVQELRSKEVMVENQAKQIAQLKKYIGETENLPKPSDLARKEKESILAKLKTYESERENQTATIQLLNIRLNSLNEILKLQETELSKAPTSGDKNKNESLLLTRWREKVFALMVQQKSADILRKKDDNNWKSKMKDLEQKLSSAHNQIEQLTHALSDREAQLNMESNTCNRLQAELTEAQQLALCLDDRVQENVQSAQCLQEFAASVWSKYQENLDILNTAMSSVKAYSQRISFASGRLEMLQGLFARREAMLKLQIEKGEIPEKDIKQKSVEPETVDSSENAYLRHELERVTRERDNLAAQIKMDSQTWDSKVLAIRGQVEEEMELLRQAKLDLEEIVKEKAQKCDQLSEKLETCENELDYANQNIEELKNTLGKQEMNLEERLEEQRREVENQFSDRLADMDRQLNDAKREQAKAVVSLRQLERQMTREKERFAEQFSTIEEHYKRQVGLIQEQLKSVEKERNLMMATLRQEGLIGKIRSERLEPVTYTSDKEEEPVRCAADVHSEIEHIPSVSSEIVKQHPEVTFEEPQEALTAVLEDLKSLTDAVLKDNDTDSDSDQDL